MDTNSLDSQSHTSQNRTHHTDQKISISKEPKYHLPIKVLLIAIIFGLGSAVGVYGYQWYQTSMLPLDIPVAPVQSTKSPTNIVDDTSDWKTYTNEEYGFEFKYPPLFDTQATEKQLIDYNEAKKKEFGESFTYIKLFSIYAEIDGMNTVGTPIKEKSFDLSGFVRSDDKGKTLEELKTIITSSFNEGTAEYLENDQSVRFFDVNGVQAIRYISCGMFCKEYIIIPVQNEYIEIQLYSIDIGNNQDVVLDQILSTFKFLGESANTADWKTYTNEEYGFEFKYPKTYLIQNQTNSETIWKAEYISADSFRENAMVLHKLPSSSKEIAINNNFKLYDSSDKSGEVIIINIDEQTTVNIDNKDVERYTFGCGVDCYFHVLRFSTDSGAYELVFNGAGGGLIKTFDQSQSTFRFLEEK